MTQPSWAGVAPNTGSVPRAASRTRSAATACRRRSRLKGAAGERTWTGWAVFAYNVETYGVYA
jgi:hypothetical protein